MYQQIIRSYLRYVLIRCARFTNSKSQTKKIAFYTLVTTPLLADRLADGTRLGRLIDAMVDVIGRDIAAEGRPPLVEQTPPEPEPLLADPQILRLARIINSLDGLSRELLILYHIEGFNTKELAAIYDTSIRTIRTELIKAEHKLTERLNLNRHPCQQIPFSDVCLLLNDLSDALDIDFAMDVADQALSCLDQWTARDNRMYVGPAYWSLN